TNGDGSEIISELDFTRALNRYLRGPEITRQRIKKEFRAYVTDHIFKEFGDDVDQLIYILTRNKPDAFLHIHTISASRMLRDLEQAYETHVRQHGKTEADLDPFMEEWFERNKELRALRERLYKRSILTTRGFLDAITDEKSRGSYSRILGDLRARAMLR